MPKDQDVPVSSKHRTNPYPLSHRRDATPSQDAGKYAAASESYHEKHVKKARAALENANLSLYNRVYVRVNSNGEYHL